MAKKKKHKQPWKDPYLDETLVTPEEREYLLAYAAADRKADELKARGYKQPSEIHIAGLNTQSISVRASKIDPDKEYTPEGLEPKEGDERITGSELVYNHPSNHNIILICPTLSAAWEAEEEKIAALKKQKKYKQASEVSIVGLTEAAISTRASKIDPDREYTPEGLKPKEGDERVKGSELVHRNFYNKGMVVISPTLIAGWERAEETVARLKQKKYKKPAEIEIVGLTTGGISSRARNIKPDKEYTPEGLEPKEGDQRVKGSELVYKNPYDSKVVLICPTLIAAWQQEEEKIIELKEKKQYKRLSEINIANLKRRTLTARAYRIDPDREYTPEGLEPKEGDERIKGSELVHKNPYDSKVTLIRPSLAVAWEQGEKTDKWLSKSEVTRELQTYPGNRRVNNLWDRLEQGYEEADGRPVSIKGHTVTLEKKRVRNQTKICLHVSELDWFAKEVGLNKPGNVINGTDEAKRTDRGKGK